MGSKRIARNVREAAIAANRALVYPLYSLAYILFFVIHAVEQHGTELTDRHVRIQWDRALRDPSDGATSALRYKGPLTKASR